MRIVFQGDSITDCGRNNTENNMGTGYVNILSERISLRYPQKNHEVMNRGVGGDNCAQLCGRWQRDVFDLRPDLISILIGTNDAGLESLRSEEVICHGMLPYYNLLLKQTKQVLPKAKIVIMEPFILDCGNLERVRLKRYGEYLEDYQRGIKALAEEYQTIYIPLQEQFNCLAAELSPRHWMKDSIHPTQAGHELIADMWMKAVEKYL